MAGICIRKFAVVSMLAAAVHTSAVWAQEEQEPTPIEVVSAAKISLVSGFSSGETAAAASTIVPDLFSGILSASIPIALPPGRGGMTPSVALTYKSTNENGWLGIGWDFNPGIITVGDELNNANVPFTLLTDSGTTSLVRHTNNTYRPQLDGSFTDYIEVGENGWLALDRSGVQYRFGSTSNTRDQGADGRATRWYVDQVVDTNGNFASYEYRIRGNKRYIHEIRYSGSQNANGEVVDEPPHAVRFEYEARPDVSIGFLDGRRIVSDRRMKSIAVSSYGKLQWKYDLAYKTSVGSRRSLLIAATQVFASGDSLRPTVIDYYESAPVFSSEADVVLPANSSGTDEIRWTGGASASLMAYPDRNADALAEFCIPEAGALTCWAREGKTLQDPQQLPGYREGRMNFDASIVQYPDINLDGAADVCAHFSHALQCWLSIGNDLQPVSSPKWDFKYKPTVSTVRYVDVNGDRFPDICRLTEPGIECFPGSQSGFRLGGGARIDGPRWKDIVVTIGNLPEVVNNTDWSEARYHSTIQFIRLNDDEMADVCARDRNGIECFISTGTSYDLANPIRGPAWADGNADPENTEWKLPQYNSTISFPDLNGDRLNDVCGRDESGIVCYLNTLGKFDLNTPIRGPAWADVVAVVPPGMLVPPPDPKDWSQPQRFESIRFTDLNGDGTDDVCGRDADGLICYLTDERGRFSTAGIRGPAFKDGGKPDWSQANIYKTLRFVDFDGNGALDACFRGPKGITCHFRTDFASDKLRSIRNQIGGSTRIDYRPSSGPAQVRMPYVQLLPSKVSTDDGRGNTVEQSFEFSNGIYNVVQNQFRGFGSVRVTTPGDDSVQGKVERYVFLQGDGNAPSRADPDSAVAKMRGRLKSHTVETLGGETLTKVENTYEVLVDGPWYFIPLKERTEIECANTRCVEVNRIQAEYESQNGNRIRQIHLGLPGIASDDRTMTWDYVPEANHISDRVATEKAFAGRATEKLVARIDYAYDDAAGCDSQDIEPARLERGNTTEIVRWNDVGPDVVVAMRYDQYGNLICSRSETGNELTLTYDGTGTFVRTSRNGLGHVVRQAIAGMDGQLDDRLYGTLLSVTDANGATTRYDYDEFGRKTSEINPDGSEVRFDFFDWGDPNKQRVRSTSAMGIWQDDYFDGLGRSWLTVLLSDTKTARSHTEYNSYGLVARSTSSTPEGMAEIWATFEYDSLGRILRREFDGSRLHQTCYAPLALVTVDPTGQRRAVELDSSGQVIKFREYAERANDCYVGPSEASRETVFERDALGLVVGISSGGRQERFKYDSLGRRIAVSTPDSGERVYRYDSTGNVVEEIDPTGQKTSLRRDILGRVIEKRVQDGSGDTIKKVLYRYDEGLNAVGRMSSVLDAVGRTTLAYAASGQLAASVRSIDGKVYSTHTVFDADGRLSKLVYPDGKVLQYEYVGRWLSRVRDDQNVLAEYADFDPRTGAQRVKYLGGTEIEVSYGKDPNTTCSEHPFRVCNIHAFGAGETILSQGLSYDSQGNVTALSDSSTGTSKFEYDQFFRLKTYSVEGVSTDWDYDRFDNPVAPVDSGTAFPEEEKRGDNRLTEVLGARLEYDTLGRVTRISKGNSRWDLTYEETGRVSKVVRDGRLVVEYIFDGDGLLLARKTPSGTTAYIGKHYECNSRGCLRKIYADGALIATEDANNAELHVLVADYKRSVRALVSGQGITETRFDYDVWGNLVRSEANVRKAGLTSGLFHAFDGSLLDEATDLYTMGQRQYAPDLHRFLQPDGIAVDPGSMARSNRYAYSFNNPATYSDPNGDLPFIVVAIIAGAAIGGIDAIINDKDVFAGIIKGAAFGAATGALAYVGYAAAFELTGSALASSTVGGALTGAFSAAANGGDIGRGVATGAITGFVGGAVGLGYGNAITADSPSEAVFGQIGRDALRGAAQGFVVSQVYGGDAGEAMLRGATRAIVAGQATNAIGYSVGLVLSRGEQPTWYRNGYVFRANSKMAGPGVNIGIFSTINPTPYDLAIAGDFTKLKNLGDLIAADQLITHEQGHISQYYSLGGGYLPAYGAAAFKQGLSDNYYETSIAPPALSNPQLNQQFPGLYK
ncbi:RHS repeat-associated core domain-containing protein [Poseidonocella pacifica]|uniref:RHS repeat-associated core domain-containing protein n=1 Tax=Poseidonocella pacifica TaxID=871651 RepID=A0A1I0UZB7_9RHOB|nr:RHS repeat-associated core domain-containing protein [Poseidonocella pacifica]SFA69449.1 RHS repeat-associated core domain-containing protein [Poseidonocella pacifica]